MGVTVILFLICQVIEAGANALVAGSAVFGASDYTEGETLCSPGHVLWLLGHVYVLLKCTGISIPAGKSTACTIGQKNPLCTFANEVPSLARLPSVTAADAVSNVLCPCAWCCCCINLRVLTKMCAMLQPSSRSRPARAQPMKGNLCMPKLHSLTWFGLPFS